MAALLEPATRAKQADERLEQAARRFLTQHPEMVSLIPILLERGDPQGRDFAQRLARIAETPETLDYGKRWISCPIILRCCKTWLSSTTGVETRNRAGPWCSEQWRWIRTTLLVAVIWPATLWRGARWRRRSVGLTAYQFPPSSFLAPH